MFVGSFSYNKVNLLYRKELFQPLKKLSILRIKLYTSTLYIFILLSVFLYNYLL